MNQIILVTNGISIGGTTYPNNSLIFAIKRGSIIEISLAGDKKLVLAADYTDFTDENNNLYASAQAVIDELSLNNTAGGGGDVTQAELDSEIATRAAADTALSNRTTILENNEKKILYFASISAATGTITKPTNSTILLDQFYEGGDAIVETLVNGQPSEQSPVTSGGAVVSVSSFDVSGNYTLSGTPSSYPVALVYILKIKAVDYQNLTTANIMAMDEISSVSQTITNGITDKAPSEDAVYDALALKANLTDIRFIIRTSDTTRYTNTGNTTENVITSLLITAGTYTNKVFEVYVKTITSTGANSKTFRMYFNSTPDLTGSPVLAATYQTSTTGGSFSRKFKDLGTTIRNYIATATSFSNFEASATSTSTENTLAVNLTGNMYIVLTAQNQISGESAIIDFCYTQNLT